MIVTIASTSIGTVANAGAGNVTIATMDARTGTTVGVGATIITGQAKRCGAHVTAVYRVGPARKSP